MAKYEPSSIPKSLVIPRAVALAEIDDVEEGEFDGRLTLNATLRIQQPKLIKNRMLRQTFYIGTDDDPSATDPQTWQVSIDAVRYNQMLRGAGVTPKGDTDVDNEAVKGRIVGIVINVREDRNGVERNRITDYFPAGEREPEVLSDDGGVGSRPAARPAKPTPKKKAAVADDDEEVEPAEEEDEDEEEDAEEEAPKQPKGAVGKKAAGSAKKKKAEMKTCPNCGDDFPRSEILDHIEGCDEGDDD